MFKNECTNKPRNLRLKNLAENFSFFASVYQDNQSLFNQHCLHPDSGSREFTFKKLDGSMFTIRTPRQ